MQSSIVFYSYDKAAGAIADNDTLYILLDDAFRDSNNPLQQGSAAEESNREEITFFVTLFVCTI